ncbi:ATP-binding protein [Vibrio sp. TH_r3]|uniref:sensor histidine kinase n=1 Tax=Vibrio sp. TH_r3 TaxID=3082084 RepID=UPI0029536803|nr:ATP-binding protein [Vibrio sp. TH_r3]MDV7104018.1 ATP-binding protein [Vibrio sp. TH_r3]
MIKLQRISSIIVILYFSTVLIGGKAYWHAAYENQNQNNLVQLNLFTSQLSSQLGKYAYIPQLLSKDSELIDALTNPNNGAQIDITNRYLHNVNTIIGASDTYLLDKNGTTIAANNWNTETSFIGRNFAFRPYFQQAINGQRGQYFALGTTSNRRGFYYAYPIIFAAERIGVIVIKTELSGIEKNWSNNDSAFVATDSDGIIFMSSNKNWLYKSLFSISEQQKQNIMQGQRYLDMPISHLGFSRDHLSQFGQIEKDKSVFFSDKYQSVKQAMGSQNLQIRVLSPAVLIFWQLFGFIIIVTLVYALIFVVWLLFRNRHIKMKQIALIEMEAKQKLEFQVMERTAELQMEIDEREKTELMLRKTQDELIQAAKLAVLGQMSASISHELNNPLAAIRSFAENGKRFLDRGQAERTVDNLTRISALTDRMANISQQLKSFARKSSSDELAIVQVYPVIISSLDLLKTQFRANQITITTSIENEKLIANINIIQLEQVIINILTNSIDALTECGTKNIEICLCEDADKIYIHIDDSGKGFTQHKTRQIFEPFYTTKKNGLGLGLSISLQIMQTMGGDLTAGHSKLGGARFTMTINKAAEK